MEDPMHTVDVVPDLSRIIGIDQTSLNPEIKSTTQKRHINSFRKPSHPKFPCKPRCRAFNEVFAGKSHFMSRNLITQQQKWLLVAIILVFLLIYIFIFFRINL